MADFRAIIDSNNRNFEKAFNGKDSKTVGSLYTENSELLPPGADGKVFTGRDQIAGFWQGGIDGGLTDLNLTIRSVDKVADDVLVETSSYKHSAGHGNYIVLWKKVGDSWFMWKDIFNV